MKPWRVRESDLKLGFSSLKAINCHISQISPAWQENQAFKEINTRRNL